MYTGEHLGVLLSKIFHLLARFLEVLIFTSGNYTNIVLCHNYVTFLWVRCPDKRKHLPYPLTKWDSDVG